MSLYNDVATGLARGNLLGTIGKNIDAATGGLANQAAGLLGGGRLATAVMNRVASRASGVAMGKINAAVPSRYRNALNIGSGMVGDLLQGRWEDAGLRLLDSSLLLEMLGDAFGWTAQEAYWGTPTALFGGISPAEAKRIYDDVRGQRIAKKNLFLIEAMSSPLDDISEHFNMFATELSYAPYTLSGEKRKIGGTQTDSVTGSEPVEMRITTMDDTAGTLKRWFKSHVAAVVASDGTMGVPNDYAIRIKIVHSFITRDSNLGGYVDLGLFRPVNLELDLSRREDALHEIQMTFTQLDSFMPT